MYSLIDSVQLAENNKGRIFQNASIALLLTFLLLTIWLFYAIEHAIQRSQIDEILIFMPYLPTINILASLFMLVSYWQREVYTPLRRGTAILTFVLSTLYLSVLIHDNVLL